MFDFLVSGKQKRAQAMLANRVNKKCMEDVQGHDRVASRLSDVTAMLLVPREGRTWEFERGAPVLGSDVSASGMCLVHTEAVEGEVLIELQDEAGNHYVRGAVKYCECIGYSFYRIGVEAKEVVHLSRHEAASLEEQRETFQTVESPE